MEKCTYEENGHACHRAAIAHCDNWNVKMADGPPMYGHVPVAPEGVDVVRIPPITVEVAVSKVKQLADQIEKRVEHYVEHAQPEKVVW